MTSAHGNPALGEWNVLERNTVLDGPIKSNLVEAAQTLFGTEGSDRLFGGTGPDTIKGGFGPDLILGEEGDDVLMGNGLYWTHWDNPQDDYWSRSYTGADDRDSIAGGPGDDWINGNAGVDELLGGPGNDTIYGGQNEGMWKPGATRTNTIHLRDGRDTLMGEEGDDWMNGNMGMDLMRGGPGNDYMRGGQDNDVLIGDDGDDTLYGDLEHDLLDGGNGNDVIVCGNDTGAGDYALDMVILIKTNTGQDTVYGFEAHDEVYIFETEQHYAYARGDRVAFFEALSTPADAEALGLAVFMPLIA